ncbi:hypothetical protein FDECE_15443 [Fusarium decemcellulare]|nr:hypothetical protein FDECE_15443 [Fusarium decemcellulare]
MSSESRTAAAHVSARQTHVHSFDHLYESHPQANALGDLNVVEAKDVDKRIQPLKSISQLAARALKMVQRKSPKEKEPKAKLEYKHRRHRRKAWTQEARKRKDIRCIFLGRDGDMAYT